MKKYILTRDFLEIAETSGVIQNLSGDANIEITDAKNEQGILLKPFQKMTIRQKVYARKVSGGGGTAQLVVLPFNSTNDSDSVSGDDEDEDYFSYDENYFDENFNRPHKKHRHHHDWKKYFPPFPPPFFPPDISNPAVVDCNDFYLLRVPKDSLNGQNKFLVTINDTKGND